MLVRLFIHHCASTCSYLPLAFVSDLLFPFRFRVHLNKEHNVQALTMCFCLHMADVNALPKSETCANTTCLCRHTTQNIVVWCPMSRNLKYSSQKIRLLPTRIGVTCQLTVIAPCFRRPRQLGNPVCLEDGSLQDKAVLVPYAKPLLQGPAVPIRAWSRGAQERYATRSPECLATSLRLGRHARC